MIKMPQTAENFFSVSISCVFNGHKFRPGVCYKLSGGIKEAVKSMEKNGQAKIYAEEMRFVTGVPHPIRKAEPDTQPVPPTAQRAESTVRKPPKKSGRAHGRGAYTNQADREFD